eukprot:TRINITY_DN9041_c0_g1_i1.p2 TRINITY_DN9041_c0_g1~~TRINITY_DN9041_c0_g1_i1.p2  ORF type:complete len:111 (+),score=37.68 TRINITY_DN9041_c0_g1_i1:125-457(+)
MSDWDTGIFDCLSDIKVCLLTWLCPVCQLAQQKATVEGHDCGLGDCIPVWCCALCCAVMVRGKIREKYGIDGSLVMDLLCTLFCGICSISQQTRQLDMKGDKPAGICMDK